MIRVNKGITKNLPILGQDQTDIIPPAGSILSIDKVRSFGLHQDFEALLIWDAAGSSPVYLFNTSVAGEVNVARIINGDGVKKLRLKIINQYVDSAQIVGLWVDYRHG